MLLRKSSADLYIGMYFVTHSSVMAGMTFFWISSTVARHSTFWVHSLPSSSRLGPSKVNSFVSPTFMPMMFSSKPSGM